MQLAPILKEVTPALARVDMQAMGYFVQVSASSYIRKHVLYHFMPELSVL